jgi:tetrahydromethanopterin S-methyltransferase subunit E
MVVQQYITDLVVLETQTAIATTVLVRLAELQLNNLQQLILAAVVAVAVQVTLVVLAVLELLLFDIHWRSQLKEIMENGRN